MIICHIGPPWGHSGALGGPKWPKTSQKWPRMAQNHQNGSKWHCMTLKHFIWVYHMIICHVGPSWALFRGPQGPQNGPKQHQKWPFMTKNDHSWPQMTLKHFPCVYYMIICHVGPSWGHTGIHGAPKWPKTAPKGPRMAQNHQNGSKCHCMTPNDPKHFQWVYNMIICHVGPPWALFRGPRGPHNGPKQHQKWPFMTKNGPS